MGLNKRQEQRCTEPMLCRGCWGGGGDGGANIKRKGPKQANRDPVAVWGHLADLVTSARGGGGGEKGGRGGEGERRG